MKNWSIDDVNSQAGKIAIVTGANSGLGYQVTLGLISKDFKVIMACRNLQKAEKAKADLMRHYPNAKLKLMSIDTSSLTSVKAFAAAFLNTYQRLDLLINNAGIMMSPYDITEDRFENQFATNYIGHFALTGLLLPLLTSTAASRVISLSSLAYKWAEINFADLQSNFSYSRTKAYGQSKRACLMFAIELQRRLSAAGINTISLAAHPGVSKTNLDQYFPSFIRTLGNLFLQNAQKGALPTLYAALNPDLKGGEFIGPDGFQQMRGNAKVIETDEYSKNVEIAKHLWKETEKMTGVFYLDNA